MNQSFQRMLPSLAFSLFLCYYRLESANRTLSYSHSTRENKRFPTHLVDCEKHLADSKKGGDVRCVQDLSNYAFLTCRN